MKVFVSHITEESGVALTIKDWIEQAFLGQVNVFVSSGPDDVLPGKKWFKEIEDALSDTKVLLVLCSIHSINRSWINFEAGAGWIKDIPVIPICYSGMTKGSLPAPLSFFTALEIEEDDFTAKLIEALTKHLGFNRAPRIPHEEMRQELKKAVHSGIVSGAIDIEEEDVEAEWGFLDHLIAMNDGFVALGEIATTISSETVAMGAEVHKTGSQMVQAQEDPSEGTSRHLQKLARGLGKRIEQYAKRLATANQSYVEMLLQTDKSLEFVLSFQEPTTEEEREAYHSFLTILDQVQSSAGGAKAGFLDMAASMDGVPNIERHLKKALTTASTEVRRFVNSIDETKEMTVKARAVGDYMLRSPE